MSEQNYRIYVSGWIKCPDGTTKVVVVGERIDVFKRVEKLYSPDYYERNKESIHEKIKKELGV